MSRHCIGSDRPTHRIWGASLKDPSVGRLLVCRGLAGLGLGLGLGLELAFRREAATLNCYTL